jgi:RNA polymerase sigma-70 factor (ECF subfamily)
MMGTRATLNLPPPFEEAMKSLEREIMRFLLRSTGDREDSLDLFQETWLRAYRGYPALRGGDGLRPWVFKIAANLCRNRARDRMRRARVIAPGDGAELDGAIDRISANGRAPETIANFRQAISRLPARQSRALKMRKLEGREYSEIAVALRCSPESARATVYQALRKLKEVR